MVQKEDDAPPTSVFKLNMNCDGCADRVKRAVRRLPGVEDVKVELSANELTVFGKVDSAAIQGYLAEKFGKKVEIVSPKKGGKKKSGDEAVMEISQELERARNEAELTVIQVQVISQELEEARHEAERERDEAERARRERDEAARERDEAVRERDEAVREAAREAARERNEAARARDEAVREAAREAVREAMREAAREAAREEAAREANIAQACVICMTNVKDMAFGCGHMTCSVCGETLPTCPICRANISIRIKLFHG